jgi:hypothetical protein
VAKDSDHRALRISEKELAGFSSKGEMTARHQAEQIAPFYPKWFRPEVVSANEIERPKGRPKRAVRARGMLMEVPAAAAEVAAAKAAHVPAAKAAAEAAHVAAAKAAAEAAHVAKVSAAEMSPAELAAGEADVAKVSAGEMTAAELAAAKAAHVAEMTAAVEMSPVAVESEATVEAVVEVVVKAVMEAADSDEDRTIKPVAIVVIRIGVAVTIVVAGAIIRPIVVVAVRIAGGDAADHSGRDGIVAIAVNVAVSVSPNVVVMAHVVTRDIPKACVATRNIPVQAV